MRAILNLFHITSVKKFLTTTVFPIMLLANNAQANFIDFDDLNPIYDETNCCWYDNPLTDQYLSQGLLIGGAWVNGSNSENVMLTSNSARLSFIDNLPTFLSMNVTSARDDALVISIYGELGLIAQKYTSGWKGSEEDYIPAIPNEFFSFSSTVGIKYIDLESYSNFRTGAGIDNLTYTYSSVPEPSPLLLISIGLFGLGVRRFKIAK